MPEFGTALYYPFIDINDPRWLRTAILFWDEIRTIVPTAIEDPYVNPETRLLQDEGLLAPLACDLRGELLEELGRRVLKYVEDPTLSHRELASVTGASRDGPRRPPRLPKSAVGRVARQRLHASKMSMALRERFTGVEQDDEGFLLLDGPFAAFYMSALATRLARDTGMVALSDDGGAFALQLDTMLDDVASESPIAAGGLLMSVVFESLALDASTPLQQVVRFRRDNERRLQALAVKLEELSGRIGSAEDPRELREKAGRYYRRTVRPDVENLKDSLHDAGIAAAWAGFRNTVTLSAAAGTALNSMLDWPSHILLGAGAFLTVADIGVQTHLAGRKLRRESPYSYLLDVERRFALPSRLTE